MDFKNGPFGGLSVSESLQKIYGTYTCQTYNDVAEEFFSLIGGEDNLDHVEPHNLHKMQASGFRTFKISLKHPEKTQFATEEFKARAINQFCLLDFEGDHILAHCYGEYADDMDLLSKEIKEKETKKKIAKS